MLVAFVRVISSDLIGHPTLHPLRVASQYEKIRLFEMPEAKKGLIDSEILCWENQSFESF